MQVYIYAYASMRQWLDGKDTFMFIHTHEGRTSLHMRTPARTRKGDSTFSRDNPRARASRSMPVFTNVCTYMNGQGCICIHINCIYMAIIDTCVSIDVRVCVCRMHQSICLGHSFTPVRTCTLYTLSIYMFIFHTYVHPYATICP